MSATPDGTASPDGSPLTAGRAGRPVVVALLGNPNTGKSTLFSALAGIPTRIGNYPGVTVEEKLGRYTHRGQSIELIDLPGTYSLVAKSPDEQVAVDVLRGKLAGVPMPDCVVVVADATNLERNLYLATQAFSLGLPTVVALTLSDVADEKGITIDAAELGRRLACPVVRVVAPARTGIDALGDAILSVMQSPRQAPQGLDAHLAAVDARHEPAAREAIARYAWIEQLLSGVVHRHPPATRPLGERIDDALTHRLWGTLVFATTMLAMFSSIFWLATPLMDGISAGMDFLSELVRGLLPEGAIRSLVVDGVLAGVGGVVVFVPQIAMLFLFVAILEGCGYLSRAAFLMDRLLCGVGLGGKSFIPLLSSFACAIPGIMAARTIENPRDRLLTILVAPLMSCSARLPVYLLLCGAFVPNVAVGFSWLRLPALVLAGMYAVGVVTAALVALVLSRTIFRGPPQPFVMELPGWRWPRWPVVLERVREAVWSFLQNAGTLIVTVSIVVWALSTYPRNERIIDADVAAHRAVLTTRLAGLPAGDPDQTDVAEELATLDRQDGTAGRAARETVGLGLEAGMRRTRELSGPRGGARHAGGDLQPRRHRPRRGGRGHGPGASPPCRHVGWHEPQGLHAAGGPVDHGVLRAVCAVCQHAGCDRPGDQELALARRHVHLHDRLGVARGLRHLPDRHLAGRLDRSCNKSNGPNRRGR